MVVIAIAGGTGDVGKTVVEELVHQSKHTVVILSRKFLNQPEVDGPKSVVIDYDNIIEMAQTLQRHNIHTIFSAMAIEGLGEQSQLNLIEAADMSKTTERFIPSEFAAYIPDGKFDEAKEMTSPVLRARQALSKTNLEVTHIANGAFMDYFGPPNISTQLRPSIWAVDVSSRRAAIPGTGYETITLTYSKDFARFVARLMDDDNWPRFSNISGSDTCFNEIVAVAEKVTGEKFSVIYDSVDDIKAGKATPISHDATTYNGIDPTLMALMLGNEVIHGGLQIPKENRLNDRYPEIVPMSIEELFVTAWLNRSNF